MTREIPLTQGKFALVSDEDFHRLARWRWQYHSTGYAARRTSVAEGRKTIFMHHLIIERRDGLVTDHINGDKLDNRRSNLRLATPAENCRNRGIASATRWGFKGVFKQPRGKGWMARIKAQGKLIHLGTHPTPEDAARAYDRAALEHYGEFARLNFPE